MPEVFDNDPSAPWNEVEETECAFCGTSCEEYYCSKACKRADIED